MATWEGSHLIEVSAVWGPPESCESVDDRRLCTWQDQNWLGDVQLIAAQKVCARTLEINDAGYVTGWRWRGNRCQATAPVVLARNEIGRPEALLADSEFTDDTSLKTEAVAIEQEAPLSIDQLR